MATRSFAPLITPLVHGQDAASNLSRFSRRRRSGSGGYQPAAAGGAVPRTARQAAAATMSYSSASRELGAGAAARGSTRHFNTAASMPARGPRGCGSRQTSINRQGSAPQSPRARPTPAHAPPAQRPIAPM
ncbi:hypothetical protein EVAR_15741_1 [Eumeta japonica]|uniref:Uncharacterized protein n=1 Tax=Eumeta variegata TaxID=151549 RepID=A0A4C1ZA58_EUMVA|nr:hypothetical protein EVAR_15741_1 [Eumeta japonica]